MKLINSLRNYILEEEFEVRIYKNKINIVNFKSIGHFDSDKVMINYNEGTLIINGKNLVVSKLTIDEVLVSGKISGIELR